MSPRGLRAIDWMMNGGEGLSVGSTGTVQNAVHHNRYLFLDVVFIFLLLDHVIDTPLLLVPFIHVIGMLLPQSTQVATGTLSLLSNPRLPRVGSPPPRLLIPKTRSNHLPLEDLGLDSEISCGHGSCVELGQKVYVYVCLGGG